MNSGETNLKVYYRNVLFDTLNYMPTLLYL